MAESMEELAPNRARRVDLFALIGILSVLEGTLAAGGLPDDLQAMVQKRLTRVGLLADEAGSRAVRQAFNDLSHRLRYVLGEYPQAPERILVAD